MFSSVTIEKLRMKPSVKMGLKVALDLQVINKAFLIKHKVSSTDNGENTQFQLYLSFQMN